MPDIIVQHVFTSDLRIGMYVSALDRPWLETPFMFQGFSIKTQEEIDLLQHFCEYVYCDFAKGIPPLTKSHKAVHQPVSPEQLAKTIGNNSSLQRGKTYTPTIAVEKELGKAEIAYQDMCQIVNSVVDDVQAGKSMQLPVIRDGIQPMIDSILRNADAFSWLITMKNKDAYTYSHSLNCSALAVNMGRQLGFPQDELLDLATGALLFDVGKIKLPTELLTKSERLNEDEQRQVRDHVRFSVEIMRSISGISKNMLDMVQYHHERHNGSGYPYGLRGEHIPVFARIAALVDCFDAITTSRVYAAAVSPYHAALKLYEWRGIDFQPELVEQFIQAIGIYPTGSLIELSSGEVGIILSQNRNRRLRPKIMLVLDREKQQLEHYPIIDLSTQLEDQQGRPLSIKHALATGTYGVDPSEFYI